MNYQRIKSLERMVDELERQLGVLECDYASSSSFDDDDDGQIDYTKCSIEELKELFVNEILTTYSALLDSKCAEMEKRIPSYMTKDDYKQEAIEYMLRWCFPRVRDFTTKGKLWTPYIKKSLYNCFVNQLKKYTAAFRSGNVVELDDYISNTIVDPTADVEREIEFYELVRKVASKLNPRDCRIFLDILDPPVKLIQFIEKFRKETGSYVPRKALAKYYNMTNTAIASTFSRFRKAIEECAAFC